MRTLSDPQVFWPHQNDVFVDLIAPRNTFLVLKQRFGDWQLTVAGILFDRQDRFAQLVGVVCSALNARPDIVSQKEHT